MSVRDSWIQWLSRCEGTAAPCPEVQAVARLSTCLQGTPKHTTHTQGWSHRWTESSALPAAALTQTWMVQMAPSSSSPLSDQGWRLCRCIHTWTFSPSIAGSRSPVLLGCWHLGIQVPKVHGLLVFRSVLAGGWLRPMGPLWGHLEISHPYMEPPDLWSLQ